MYRAAEKAGNSAKSPLFIDKLIAVTLEGAYHCLLLASVSPANYDEPCHFSGDGPERSLRHLRAMAAACRTDGHVVSSRQNLDGVHSSTLRARLASYPVPSPAFRRLQYVYGKLGVGLGARLARPSSSSLACSAIFRMITFIHIIIRLHHR